MLLEVYVGGRSTLLRSFNLKQLDGDSGFTRRLSSDIAFTHKALSS
jgi:hypothetical protein